jgi:hypothetical protein
VDEIQPYSFTTVKEYNPDASNVFVVEVIELPSDQAYVVPPLAVKLTKSTFVVAPELVIIGSAFTVIVLLAVFEHPDVVPVTV